MKMKVWTIFSPYHNTVVACGHALRVFITCCMCGHLSSLTNKHKGSYKTWTGFWTGMESGICARALVLLVPRCSFV